MEEECGITGVVSPENLSLKIYYALYSLQHRGQESTGIATVSDGINLKRKMGLVSDAITKEDLQELDGEKGIGHVRYSTSGDSRIENTQPLVVTFSDGELALAHNGHIVNAEKIKKELEQEGHVFTTANDSEIIAHLIVNNYLETNDIKKAFKKATDKIIGSYSLVILLNNRLIGARDPKGIKPLSLGKVDESYILASESVAIDTLGGELIRDIEPGELIEITEDKTKTLLNVGDKKTSNCFFEHVYFARPDSVMDGRLNYDCRYNIGKKLGEKYPVEDADLVSPVPDSGITFAIGYAEETDKKYLESLMKNRYVGRTFIMPGQGMRETAVRLKLNGIKSNVKDKKIVLVDDSIVRGTTSTRIIKMLREMGAEEIHFRVGSPKIVSPCYFGIDMATKEELIAPEKTEEEIAQKIGADSLRYIKIDEMVKAMESKKEELCLGCLTENYPYDISKE